MDYNNVNKKNNIDENDNLYDQNNIEEQKQIQDCADQLLSIILKLVVSKLDSHKIVSGTVVSYNEKSHKAVVKPVGETSNWTGILNQSVFRVLKQGTCVKMFCQDGNSSNAWIFAAFENRQTMETFGDELINTTVKLTRRIDSLEKDLVSLRRRVIQLENASSSTT